ncbi:nucleotidyltransferase domain-containing protein [Geotalea uraniireducens]|uniref:DNA polymerase, beta domain protein region n=1 Tax=Geotalea uraniireducens (strain Rf4) TaxID=351605 RepID=A5GAR6_GEOUR|nr:nucleotidyltransferase domain-containing protein [Geotalea uraniireducens]ABQ25338.1 DNA polymerase, beta domain protein region [Geotalea uraniireducens Rf4]
MPDDNEKLKYGLKQTTIEKINGVFAAHPQIEQVILYGSRAKGNYRNGSDIDLTIRGKGVTLSQLLKIETELDDLLLPYKIDLSLLHQIDDPGFIDHIQRVGIVFYEKPNLPAGGNDGQETDEM